MSPKNKKKLNILRGKLDKVDNQLIEIIKVRTNLVKEVIKLKEYKNEIVDKKRISVILKKIKKKSILKNIDPKITNLIWYNMIYAYNHFPIPLPFIEDRHYIFKIRRVSKTEVYWHLVDYLEVKSNMRLKKITDENPSAIYMDYGAGFWETVPLTENLSQVSYVLYMDSGGSLSNNLNDLLTSQSIINLYKSVLNEGYKKSKQ